MILHHCLLAIITCVCFSAALPSPESDAKNVLKALLDAHPTFPDITPISSLPAARLRRTVSDDDRAQIQSILSDRAIVLAQASLNDEGGGWKLHVSLNMVFPPAIFDIIVEEFRKENVGLKVTSELMEDLNTKYPTLAVAESSRHVLGSYRQGEEVTMLFGREWEIAPFDPRGVQMYLGSIAAYVKSYNRRSKVWAGVVPEAHVGSDPEQLERAWRQRFRPRNS